VFNLLLGAVVVVIMVVEFTTMCAISAYHHTSCEFEPRLWRGVLATDQWFSPGPPVSSSNKTDHHDITEIMLKVLLNTITPNPLCSTLMVLQLHVYNNFSLLMFAVKSTVDMLYM
jgi:hypothetical protein